MEKAELREESLPGRKLGMAIALRILRHLPFGEAAPQQQQLRRNKFHAQT
jgi:hypothetical protein